MSIIDRFDTSVWEPHVGPDIGGIPPTRYGYRILPDGVVEFSTAGGPYADYLEAIHRPLCPSTGKLSLSFDLAVDASTDVQAREFDTILAIGGMKYNLSAQFNVATGAFQIADKNGNWVDSGWRPSPFTPLRWYAIRFAYAFDTAAKTSSFLQARVDNSAGAIAVSIPPTLQKVPAAPSNWADSCSLQVQLDIGGAAGEFTEWVRNVVYTWD